MYEREKEIIRSSVSMLDVAKKIGMEVNRSGYARCPFHDEKTASLRVYEGRRGWHCFGCHAGGDVIAFVMQYFELKFTDALKWLSEGFSLGFKMGGYTSRLEREKQLRDTFLAEKRRREMQEARKKQDEEWQRVTRLRHRLVWLKKEAEPFSDAYCYAAHELPEIEGQLDLMYEEMMQVDGSNAAGTTSIHKRGLPDRQGIPMGAG